MSGTAVLDKMIPRTRRAFAVGLALALAVLAATILSGLFFVRDLARDQIVHRDAEALYATTLMEQLDDLVPPHLEVRSDAEIGFDAAIRASRLRGVMGIRFFDADGRFSDTFPATVMPTPLDAGALEALGRFETHGSFANDVPLSEVFIYLPDFSEGRIARAPILYATIPLHQRHARELAGIAQFIIDGGDVAEEFAVLDRRLAGMATVIFLVSGFLLTLMLWPVLLRIERLQGDLARRGERLRRANEELALAARVSAVGAVSAHLMHGLRNPLASLSEFVTNRDSEEEDWDDALAAARRMRAMVERVMEVLSAASGEAAYEWTVGELLDDVRGQVREGAERKGVGIYMEGDREVSLSNQSANLVGLILVNLLDNAIEATAQGGTVVLSALQLEGRLHCCVMDQGPGVSAERVEALFVPGASTREGGSGLGLAISKRVADFLGADLALKSTSESGSVFELALAVADEGDGGARAVGRIHPTSQEKQWV